MYAIDIFNEPEVMVSPFIVWENQVKYSAAQVGQVMNLVTAVAHSYNIPVTAGCADIALCCNKGYMCIDNYFKDYIDF